MQHFSENKNYLLLVLQHEWPKKGHGILNEKSLEFKANQRNLKLRLVADNWVFLGLFQFCKIW